MATVYHSPFSLEKWYAIKSPRGEYMHNLLRTYILDVPDSKALARHLNLLVERAAGYGTIVRMVFLVEQLDSAMPKLPLPSPQVITKYLQAKEQEASTTLNSGFQKHIKSILNILVTLATDPNYTYAWKPLTSAKRPRLSPVEFALIGILISEFQNYALGKLAGFIMRLRTLLHQKHTGQLQMNGRVFATFDSFLAMLNEEEPTRGQKRKVIEEDPEAEYRPSPPAKRRSKVTAKPASSSVSLKITFLP